MAASASDYFKKVGLPGNATTLAAPGHTIGGTSFTVDSTSLWPTDTGVTFAIDTVDGTGARINGTYTVWDGVVSSATTITGAVLRYGTDQNYSAGSTTRVYILPTSTRENKLVDGLLVTHELTGLQKSGVTYPSPVFSGTATGTYTLGGTPTITSPTLSGTVTGTYTLGGTPTVASNFPSWLTSVLPAVSSVTCNGNRSYDVVFNSTVASYLTPGMRIRTTRTAAAPTGAISLNGSTQYANKTSPAGMTFTDDFVVSVWVRLTSYPAAGNEAGIVSRFNGTNGWDLKVSATGQVRLVGHNGALGNYSEVVSYQSLPLNKWVHVAAQLDMSTFTATTTTSYIMFDGLDVPASVSRGGTNPTALVQAGNLEIGTLNAGSFFTGQIAQVAIYNAKVTQSAIRATMSQTLTGSETSLISAYKLDQASGLTDLNTGNANNLTAQGSPTYSTDSPFTIDANGTPGGTYDFGIVTKVSTTTATIQVPEGCAIPTSGGVSAVDLSSWKAPFGMPVDAAKWYVENLYLANVASASLSANTWKAITGATTNFPIGAWELGLEGCIYESGGSVAIDVFVGLGTTSDAQPDYRLESGFYPSVSGTAFKFALNRYAGVNLSTATTYYLNVKASTVSTTTIGIDASSGAFVIRAKLATL